MLKLALITGALVVGGVTAVNTISSYLAIDDLKDCSAPDLLVPKCAPANAIVVISGGDTQARTSEAIRLYKAGWAPKLLLSGAARDPSAPSNAETMRNQAIQNGVPESALLLDTIAKDTVQNAQGTSKLLGANDTRLILVTSPYHQRRASLEFGHVFGDRVTIVNHPTPSDQSWGAYWWTTPRGWWLAVTETTMSLVISSWR